MNGTRKTYVIKVTVEDNTTSYADIEETIYNLGMVDVDLLETYED